MLWSPQTAAAVYRHQAYNWGGWYAQPSWASGPASLFPTQPGAQGPARLPVGPAARAASPGLSPRADCVSCLPSSSRPLPPTCPPFHRWVGPLPLPPLQAGWPLSHVLCSHGHTRTQLNMENQDGHVIELKCHHPKLSPEMKPRENPFVTVSLECAGHANDLRGECKSRPLSVTQCEEFLVTTPCWEKGDRPRYAKHRRKSGVGGSQQLSPLFRVGFPPASVLPDGSVLPADKELPAAAPEARARSDPGSRCLGRPCDTVRGGQQGPHRHL